jgi:dynein heavy chain
MGKLSRKVDDLDSLRFIMNLLVEIREKESSIEMEMQPVMDMYQMLEMNLSSNFMDKDEIDKKTVLKSNWNKLVNFALIRSDELSCTQIGFKSELIEDIAAFSADIQQVRK